MKRKKDSSRNYGWKKRGRKLEAAHGLLGESEVSGQLTESGVKLEAALHSQKWQRGGSGHNTMHLQGLLNRGGRTLERRTC